MKEKIIEVLIALKLLNPIPQEEIKEVEKNLQLQVMSVEKNDIENGLRDEFWGTSINDYELFQTLSNENGDIVNITMNTYKNVYTLDYETKQHDKIEYHYHSLEDLENDLELHQKNILEGKELTKEEIKELKEIEVRRNGSVDNNLRLRVQRVNIINRINELEKEGWGFLSEYQSRWHNLTSEEIEESKYTREKEINNLKIYNGFDIENNIDYELVLGQDWKCKIHTIEGRDEIRKYYK